MNFLKVLRTAAVSILVAGFWMNSAFAGANGDTINATYYYPDTASHYNDFGTIVVGTSDVFTDPQGNFQLRITDTQIIADHFTPDTFWSPAVFNGLILTNFTKNFSSYTLDGSTNMVGFGVSNFSVSGNVLAINWQSLSFNSNTKVVLNISAVPEPEPYAMLLVGLGLVGAIARRRQRS